MDYYKATRLDGTDFYSGTIKYEVGKRTTHPTSKRRTKDHPSTYLSVSTVPTDCTGFQWPCRLFRVRGVGKAMTAMDLPNKRAFLSVDVVEELPAHMVFGPQGEHVVALIERAARLTSDEAEQLAETRAGAWVVARDTVKNTARNAARSAARDTATRGVTVGMTWAAEWWAARNAAREVAMALVVRDLIGSSGFTQAHYDLLTGPWRKVIGPVHPDDAELKGTDDGSEWYRTMDFCVAHRAEYLGGEGCEVWVATKEGRGYPTPCEIERGKWHAHLDVLQ